MKALIIFLLLSAVAVLAFGRDRSVIREFRSQNACPSTQQFTGPCPGYVVDHIMPLCAGGPDAVRNMQWQERTESYRKDALEREICRSQCKK